ncbi:hypothetical protein D9619_006009 [Psilocybe cf. subviscida]|uniref:CS domain-containing protein n=1 Tax=Psilocybe cf. subviscida TaxID=2480587 RepID=A0A8H5BWI8_9AGAR|nr:hypothetical protein D9619_006009 [Psilocybe cf. subviscida]
MITPRFSCSQTESAVIVTMYCPSVRAADVEINVDDTLVTVHVNPYFLRLNFAKPLTDDDDDSAARYDPSTGTLTVTLTKQIKGEVFEDLDLLAKLLAPRRTQTEQHTPLIEMLSSESNPEVDDDLAAHTNRLTLERDEIEHAAENDWQLSQEVPPAGLPPLNLTAQKYYGFLDMHSGYLRHVMHTENEVNELDDEAETCTREERRARRLKHENEKWDPEHYLADFMDDEYIEELLTWKHPHILASSEDFEYSEKENMEILRLPRKEYLISASQAHDLYLTLCTLLFAYTYESRATQLDPTPESAWTICNLIPAFSALDPPRSYSDVQGAPHAFTQEELRAVMAPSYRRSLTFPLHRSFAFAESCRLDSAELLLKGKRTVMRCLLEMKAILDHHEVYYVYSKIWLDDFCVWVQAYADDGILSHLGQSLMEARIDKASMDWDLDEIEQAAIRTLEGDEEARPSDSDDETDLEDGSDSDDA